MDIPDIQIIFPRHLSCPITRDYRILSVSGDAITSRRVNVCTEDNITIYLNDQPLTSLKITPDDFPAFTVGFVIDEGLVPDITSIQEVKIDPPDIRVTARVPACEEGSSRIEIRSSGVGISTPAGCQGKPLGNVPATDRDFPESKGITPEKLRLNLLCHCKVQDDQRDDDQDTTNNPEDPGYAANS
jgi:formate dehydrogenase assembly factor FdhD